MRSLLPSLTFALVRDTVVVSRPNNGPAGKLDAVGIQLWLKMNGVALKKCERKRAIHPRAPVNKITKPEGRNQ
jgi:hypothetical protein